MSTPTFTRHKHGAWCHPAADGCPSEIPAPDLSPAEAARVTEFDAVPPTPESWAVVVAMLALADDLDREGQMVVHNGTMNRHSYITRRIRAAVTAALDPS